MNAAIVCVDYSDYLAITLPYNRHHFDRVLVVTTERDKDTIRIADETVCDVHTTDSFYDDGAAFNKWKGLEEALTACDFRHGWLAILDADVLWPKDIQHRWGGSNGAVKECGKMYSPRRRMYKRADLPLPPEEAWCQLPYHRYNGWSGYTQIFHCDDPHLPKPPWHHINYTHAGIADSFFSELWPNENRIRPNWEVLHLGQAGMNWAGRTTKMLDGTDPPNVEENRKRHEEIVAIRRQNRKKGANVFDPIKYEDERLS